VQVCLFRLFLLLFLFNRNVEPFILTKKKLSLQYISILLNTCKVFSELISSGFLQVLQVREMGETPELVGKISSFEVCSRKCQTKKKKKKHRFLNIRF